MRIGVRLLCAHQPSQVKIASTIRQLELRIDLTHVWPHIPDAIYHTMHTFVQDFVQINILDFPLVQSGTDPVDSYGEVLRLFSFQRLMTFYLTKCSRGGFIQTILARPFS